MELHNILPFEMKYSQPLENLLSVTKYILETNIPLMCVGRTIVFKLSNGISKCIRDVLYMSQSWQRIYYNIKLLIEQGFEVEF
jgi:hypothetical protein